MKRLFYTVLALSFSAVVYAQDTIITPTPPVTVPPATTTTTTTQQVVVVKEEDNGLHFGIKVAPALAWLKTDSKDFERKDGEITINGKIYHYVKQKVYEGNMILMCLPDEQKMHLQNAKDDFFKLANELQSNSTSSKKSGNSTVVMKLVISDYDKMQTTSSVVYATRLFTFFPDNLSATLQKGEHLIPEQPPRA